MHPTALLRKAAPIQQTKRQFCKSLKIGNFIPWLKYEPCPPIHSARGFERGNRPKVKTGGPEAKPFNDLMDFFFYNQTLRVIINRSCLVLGFGVVVFATMDAEKKAFLDPELRTGPRARERAIARYSKAPEFVRKDENAV